MVLPIVGVAFLLRLLFVALTYKDLPLSNHFEQFGAEMGWTARSIATGHGFSSPFFPQTGPTALVCPLFPLLLAGIFKIFGVYTKASAFAALALNSCFSSLTAAVIFFGMRPRFGYRTARVAAWMWALYPYAVYYSAVYLWDFALTSFLFACCFFLALNWRPFTRIPAWAGFGVLLGLAALSNPSILTLAPVLLAYALSLQSRPARGALLPLFAATGALLLTLAPWTMRNQRVFHRTVLMRDGFWGEFYAGNAGDTSHSNPGWTHPASNQADMQQYQRLGEAGYMAWKRELSIQHVRQYPGAFGVATVRRATRFWTGYWSFSRNYLADESLDLPNVPLCTLLTLMMVSGSLRLFKRDRQTAILFIATFLVFPLPYYVTHASIDYRQPIEPVIVGAIAYGSTELLRPRRSHAADNKVVAT